ncbi:hypothetical protein LguiA_012111 [Lonicera macranthoides]
MAFSSPLYLDHHHNWHQLQQPNNQQVSIGENPQLTPPSAQPGGGESSIRPGSMVDRARLAKLPLPEAGLNCPRCDSTNTKFCYFNNYSLTQPRHFCKTCRRYWTRGGALRSVPVGGGCRRNKRSKSRSSKSPIKISNPNSSSVSASPSSSEMAGGGGQFPQLPLMSALQNLPQYGGGINGTGNISSNIGAFQSQMVAAGGNSQNIDGMGFQIGNNSGGGAGAGAGVWRLPFLAGFEPQANLFNYQSEGTSVGAPVKEEESRGLNLSRQFLGISENNNQYWVGNGNGNNSWAEFSGLNSTSSTTHFL